MARILVADDEEAVRTMLRQMLERAGHEVEEAADGEQAIERYRSRPPDLVLTDVLMPNKGGIVAIKELRSAYPQARIIAISGGGKSGRLSFLATARTFPGVRTLKKPVRRTELLQLVDEVLAES